MKALKNILIAVLIAALGFLGYLGYKNMDRNDNKDNSTVVEQVDQEQEDKDNEENITVDEKNINDLKEYLLEDIAMVIVDLRDENIYGEGHIEGAISIPYGSIEELSKTNLLDKEQNIYVYSSTKEESDEGAKKLIELGYTNVHSLGSIDEYEGELIH